MQINFDENCSSTEKITKALVEKVLDFVDNSKTKRKDSIRDALKNYDDALLILFDRLIDRKAIVMHTEKIKGHNRSMLSTANRNLVFYSIKKMIDVVPSEQVMKDAFIKTWINGTSKIPSNCAKFNYLKEEEDPFKSFMELSFGDFYLLASYCFCEYERLKQLKEKEEQAAQKEPVKKKENVKIYRSLCNDISKFNKDKNTDTKEKFSKEENKQEEKTMVTENSTPQSSQSSYPVSSSSESVMDTILDDMSKFDKDEKENVSKNTAFEQYRNKREQLRKSVADKIDALHMLADINAYLKYSLVELKRMLDPALFRGNQYANLKYSNSDVFECGFDNINILMTKINFDIESLERMKKIVDNAIEVKSLFDKAKDNFEDGITKEELEIVKSLPK